MTFQTLGPALAKLWGAPSDESFWKQGVVVDDTIRLNPSDQEHLESLVSKVVKEAVVLTELRFKAHCNLSNGVWLHTDRQKKALRDIHLIFYFDSLGYDDGGVFGLYSWTNSTTSEDSVHSTYVSGQPITLPKKITTVAIGGEWNRQNAVNLHLCRSVIPKRGRAILMDCREKENIHAVSAMRKKKTRRLMEAWFKVS